MRFRIRNGKKGAQRLAVVFGYAFPHRKTAEGLYRLRARGVPIDYVIGAPFKTLSLRRPLFKDSAKTLSLRTPAEICSDLSIRYYEFPHESPEAIRLITETKPERGVILGARILPKAVIRGFSEGILNMHPGLLPFNAGLHNVEWAINNQFPQGVSVHLIDESVDGGKLLGQRHLDTIPTSFRIRDLESTLGEIEMQFAEKFLTAGAQWPCLTYTKLTNKHYHEPMSGMAEILARAKWPGYLGAYPQIVGRFSKSGN